MICYKVKNNEVKLLTPFPFGSKFLIHMMYTYNPYQAEVPYGPVSIGSHVQTYNGKTNKQANKQVEKIQSN